EGGRPTEAERRLIEAAREGKAALCKDLGDAERVVSPRLIEALTTDRFRHRDWPEWKLHDMGLRLWGAVVKERLILKNRRVPAALMLLDCRIEQGFDLDGARIGGHLFFSSSRLSTECRLMAAEITGQ